MCVNGKFSVIDNVARHEAGPSTNAVQLVSPHWSSDHYAAEQIRHLVRQIFFPGWPKPARQVVFSSIEEHGEVAGICLQVGEELAAEVPGKVAVINTDWRTSTLDQVCGRTAADTTPAVTPGLLRMFSRQISDRLWLVPLEVFVGDNDPALAATWLRGRLAQLRLDFDYALLHAPPAGLYTEASLLASLTDGIILVIQANLTRRGVAQKTKQELEGANARLLGTVLTDRTFPIPEGIYKRL